MNARTKAAIERSGLFLIRMSASKLVDDTKIHALRPPMAVKAATATFAEVVAMKANAAALRAQFAVMGR